MSKLLLLDNEANLSWASGESVSGDDGNDKTSLFDTSLEYNQGVD